LARLALRRVAAAAVAGAVIVYAWTLLEQPVSWTAFGVVWALAVLPAAAPSRLWCAVLAGVATGAALSVAFETWPHTAAGRAWTALHDAPVVRSPFDPASYATLHGLVVVVAFLLALAASLGSAARRPLVVAAAVALGIGFPAALLEDAHAFRLGLLALAAVLGASALLGVRELRRVAPVTALGAVVLASSGGLAAAGLAPGAAHLDWRGWDPFSGGGRVVDVHYAWDANYTGVDFPAVPTVVLKIRAPKEAQYWRVSTLETFDGDRWIENLYPVAMGGPQRRLPPDPLVPHRDDDKRGLLRQFVTVEGLAESRVAAAGEPARIYGPSLGRLSYLEGGVMRATRPIRRGAEYAVWSYAPRPTPRDLARSPARYPPAADRYLGLGRTRSPGYGVPGREAAVDRIFNNDLYLQLRPYRPLWHEARRITGKARSPYEATLMLERWFRSEGGFRYEEHPPAATKNPPLVDFVEVTRAGYCQHYAGAMALMLRMLGIPARVAVGFTSGTWKAGVWTVTDQQAHAWVEAWFAGYGWMTFDPTPGRGSLSAVYTLASDSADAVRALGTGRFLDFTPTTRSPSPDPTSDVLPQPQSPQTPWWLVALLCLPFAVGALVMCVKRLRRATRLRRREPRRLAAGVRDELVGALVDRGADIDPGATTTALREASQRVLRLSTGALAEALAEARFGPPERADAAARRARAELENILEAAGERERPRERVRTLLSLRSFRPSLTASGTMGR
jgi:transglutaminase-like putative cysteine protease